MITIKKPSKKWALKPTHILIGVLISVVAVAVGLHLHWGLTDYTVA